MTILLTGGGSGGHITPLLAVARELKKLRPEMHIIAVCEQNASFADLYHSEPAIDEVKQISAGKYRRYSGVSVREKLTDVRTVAHNVRDIGRTAKGYLEARKLLKALRPDAILIKGGFVAVPVGKAAASLGIPYITHDSDASPGLANRLIAKKAIMHATGMPVEFYAYPKKNTVYTGIPLSDKFKKITPELRNEYRKQLGLEKCKEVIAVVGGSQGAEQLNNDFIKVVARLMDHRPTLGVTHITGAMHEQHIKKSYDGELLADERSRVVVTGFTDQVYVFSGAADVVVTRAGATNTAEFALQGLPLVIVPGKLAGGHQEKNAKIYQAKGAAVVVSHADSEGLLEAIQTILDDPRLRRAMAQSAQKLAQPDAARKLAMLTLEVADGRNVRA